MTESHLKTKFLDLGKGESLRYVPIRKSESLSSALSAGMMPVWVSWGDDEHEHDELLLLGAPYKKHKKLAVSGSLQWVRRITW